MEDSAGEEAPLERDQEAPLQRRHFPHLSLLYFFDNLETIVDRTGRIDPCKEAQRQMWKQRLELKLATNSSR